MGQDRGGHDCCRWLRRQEQGCLQKLKGPGQQPARTWTCVLQPVQLGSANRLDELEDGFSHKKWSIPAYTGVSAS